MSPLNPLYFAPHGAHHNHSTNGQDHPRTYLLKVGRRGCPWWALTPFTCWPSCIATINYWRHYKFKKKKRKRAAQSDGDHDQWSKEIKIMAFFYLEREGNFTWKTFLIKQQIYVSPFNFRSNTHFLFSFFSLWKCTRRENGLPNSISWKQGAFLLK